MSLDDVVGVALTAVDVIAARHWGVIAHALVDHCALDSDELETVRATFLADHQVNKTELAAELRAFLAAVETIH